MTASRRRVAAAVTAVVASAVLLVVSPGEAHAVDVGEMIKCVLVSSPFDCKEPQVRPVPPGSEVSSILNDDAEGDASYEKYGAGSYQLAHQFGGTEFTSKAVNSLAEGVLSIAAALTAVAIAMLRWAFSFELGDSMLGVVSTVVGSLRASWFDDALLAASAVALTVVGFLAASRRPSVALSTFVWVVAAVALSLAYVNRPAESVGALSDAATASGRLGLEAAGLAGQGGGDQALVDASERLWDSYVTKPWQQAQFGSVAAGDEYGQRMLDVNTYSDSDLQQIRSGGDKARRKVLREHQDDYEALLDDINGADPAVAETVRGGGVQRRLGWAVVALVMALLMAVLMIGVALYMVFLLGFLLVGAMLLPLVLGFAPIPGWGRRVSLGGVAFLAGLVLQRAMIGVGLGVALVLQGALVAAAADAGGLIAGYALSMMTVVAVLVFRSAIFNALRAGGRVSMSGFHRDRIPGGAVAHTAAAWAGSELAERTFNGARQAPRQLAERSGALEMLRGRPLELEAGSSAERDARRVLAEVADGRDRVPAASAPRRPGSSALAAAGFTGATTAAAAGGSDGVNGGSRPSRQPRQRAAEPAAPAAADGDLRGAPLSQLPQVPLRTPEWQHSIPDRGTLRPTGRPSLPVIPAGQPAEPRQPTAAPADLDAPWQRPAFADADARYLDYEQPPSRGDAAQPRPALPHPSPESREPLPPPPDTPDASQPQPPTLPRQPLPHRTDDAGDRPRLNRGPDRPPDR